VNCTVYLFGEFGLGYTQYPQDGAEDIFRHGAAHSQAQTQIVIHRDGNLMYYAYIRKLDEGEGHYNGYGFKVDGLMFRDLTPLFDLFGSTLENMVIADRLLSLNDRGHIVANVGLLIEKRPEVERVINLLCTSVQALSTQFIPLPKVIFDHLSTQVWTFGEDADPSDILKACQMSGYTIVQKGTMQLSTDKPIVAIDVPAIKEEKENKESTKDDNAHGVSPSSNPSNPSNSSNPSYSSRWDGMKTFLLTMLLLALGGLAYTGFQLWSANKTESNAMSSYNKVKMTNVELHQKIVNLEAELEASELKNREMEKALVRQDSVIAVIRDYYKIKQPLLATRIFITREGQQKYEGLEIGTHVRGSNDMKLQPHVSYYGLEKGSARLTLRWYSPRRFGFFDFGDFTLGSKTHDDIKTFDIETGEHQLDFDVWSGDPRDRWEHGRYCVELWAGNECLQRKEFYVD
jgi:hypothetical protein